MRPATAASGPGRRPAAVGTAVALVLATGCANSNRATSPPPAASPPAPTIPPPAPPPPPAVSLPAPTPAPASPDLQQIAVRYLAARENAISSTHPTPRSWLADVHPVMTPDGWQQLAASVGDGGGGYPYATARAHRWSVTVTVACRHNPDAGPPAATTITLTCTVTDHTVDTHGQPVPTAALPALWPYTGPQPPAILAIRQVAGRWLVDADQTGRAG